MRKAFRTTIDEGVLLELKKMALQQGGHVNDIIEKLVLDKLHDNHFTENLDKFQSLNTTERQIYLEHRLTQVIRDVMYECNLHVKPPNLPEIIAQTISNIVLSDEMLFGKK